MRFLPILLGLSALVSARCGTPKPTEDQKARHKVYANREAKTAGRHASRDLFEATIDTYVHVIDGAVAPSNVSINDRIHRQIDVLNKEYKNTGFSFNLVNISHTNNPRWRGVVDQSVTELEMKGALRRGDYKDLNLYIDTIMPVGILGYSTFPDRVDCDAFKRDGVVVDPRTLPGGQYPYDLGITAVHEIGHWLNLLHTFQPGNDDDKIPGCFGAGDYIWDTPAEGYATYGCPASRDTCVGVNETSNVFSEPGPDPIHNFMDYTDDRCLTEFTSGQIARMWTSWIAERRFYSNPCSPGIAGRRLARPGSWP